MYDQPTLTTNSLSPSAKSCRDAFLAPLLTELDQATAVFVPPGSNTGCSLKLTFVAVHKDSEAGGLADAREMPFLSFLISLK